MDKSKNKKIASIIIRELSEFDKPVVSRPKLTNRDICIKVITIFSSLVFLLNTFIYYSQVFKNTKVTPSTAVSTNINNATKPLKYNSQGTGDSEALKKKGDEALKLNKEQEAIGYYKQFMCQNPQDSNVLISLINLLIKNKLYEDSLQYLDMLISKEPLNVSAYKVKGSSLYLMDRYDEAIKVFCKAVEMDKGDSNSYKLMGDISLKQEKFENAVNYYKKALSIKENDVAVYQNIGLAEAKSGKYDEALKYYEKALKLDPQNKQVLINKQEILNILKHNDKN